jgi:tripartite-type tricarboxylate transporter receptor subunit TctC
MKTIRISTSVALLSAALLSAPVSAFAQTYPARPVTFIVPFPPGGGTDISARTLAARLAAKWGQSVLIENRGGAGGIVGADAAARAKPDGYTFLIANVGVTSINPALYSKLPYNHETAFTPVSLVCELPFVLMASPAFPPNTVGELIAFSKAKPGAVTFASSGSGGSPHLTAEIFQAATGTKWTHIPYKGGGPAMIDLMSGQVNLLFASVLEGSGHIKAGKLKGLAVSHAKRNPAIPDVPTLAEAGVKDAESGSWIALLAPAGTSSTIIEKTNADVNEAVAVPEVRDKLIGQGAVPQASTPKQLQALIDADLRRYGRIIREQGLKAE